MVSAPVCGRSSCFRLKESTLEVREAPLRAAQGDIPFGCEEGGLVIVAGGEVDNPRYDLCFAMSS